MVFDNGVIKQHPLYTRYPSTLNAIAERDYQSGSLFDKRIECIDTDAYEKSLGGNLTEQTMDAAVGIKSYANNKSSNARLLLVELRMGYKNAGNIRKDELENKVRHTKELLGQTISYNKESFLYSAKIS